MSPEQKQQKNLRFEGAKSYFKKRALWPAVIGAGVLLPASMYAGVSITENVSQRSEELSRLLDNQTAETVEGVAMAAGVALTVNSYLRGEKYDYNKLKRLRTAGPALLTAAAGSALLDSQTTINLAIPAGLALSGTYAVAATNIIDAFDRTRDPKILASTVAAGAGMVAAGATIFLAAAGSI